MKKRFLTAALLALLGTSPQAFAAYTPPGSASIGVIGKGSVSGNSPTGASAVVGGIAANQMAAHNDALDKILAGAILSNNPEGVRQALKAGVSLALDFRMMCGSAAVSYEGVLQDSQITSKGHDLGNSDVMGAFHAKGAQLTALPAACSKLHMRAALALHPQTLNKDVDTTDTWTIPAYEMELTTYFGDAAHPSKNIAEKYQSEGREAASRYRDSRTILALLDANTPTADKAFYPAYLETANVSPDIFLWVMERYAEALPEIRRARDLREPLRDRWDSIAKTAYERPVEEANFFRGRGGVAITSLWSTSFIEKLPPGAQGDDLIWLRMLDVALKKYGKELEKPEKRYLCRSENFVADLNDAVKSLEGNLGSNANSNAQIFQRIADLRKEHEQVSAFLEKHDYLSVSDFDNWRSIRPLEAYGEFHSESRGWVAKADLREENYRKKSILRLLSYLMGRAETKRAMSASSWGSLHKTASNGTTLLHSMVPTGPYSIVPGALIRKWLEMGADINLMDREGKTPLDYALNNPQGSPVFQAFMTKDFDKVSCVKKPAGNPEKIGRYLQQK